MASLATPSSSASSPGVRRRGFFGVVARSQTYRNLLYLLVICPLGWVYLQISIGGLEALTEAFGVLGFLLFVAAVLAGSWYVAMFERGAASWLLRVALTPMAAPVEQQGTVWERIRRHLGNIVMWKILAFLALKAFLGLATAVATLLVLLASMALTLAPLEYAGAIGLYAAGAIRNPNAIVPPLSNAFFPFSVLPHSAQFSGAALSMTIVVAVLGFLLFTAALHALNGLAWLWGRFDRAMLGVNEKDLQLAQARALAEHAQARAENADRSRRELILSASHELRTPVASIRAHIESLLILGGDTLPEKTREFLAITQREAERLSTLVDDLLMLARSDADELRLDIRPVAVGDVVEEVYGALEPLARHDRQVTLVRDVSAALPLALADRNRLGQVLLNMVRNAITYTPTGGVVSIEATEATGPNDAEGIWVAVIVTDTGIGIPEEDLERIFERFYRTDASRARETGGFGLGLAIARDLIQAMGGSIAAENVPEGGSRFRVLLRGLSTPSSAQRAHM